jgi:hypothetical protein
MYAETGDYVVRFYDKYGESLFGQIYYARCLSEAHELAKAKFDGEAACYCVFRCIYNSTDTKNRFDV